MKDQLPIFTRRELLKRCGCGFGYLAFTSLFANLASTVAAAEAAGLHKTHFPARAKRVIFLFMHGGPSQVDTFDYKPTAQRDHGKPIPFARPKWSRARPSTFFSPPGDLSNTARAARGLVNYSPKSPSVRTTSVHQIHAWIKPRHGGACLSCIPAPNFHPSQHGILDYLWLGSENSMPGFLTICPTQSHGGANNFGSAFLPAAVMQGTAIGAGGIPARDARIPFITNQETPRDIQRMEIDYSQGLNRKQLEVTGPDRAIEGRIESFELAFRMQAEAPELQDLSKETEATQKNVRSG